MHNRHKKVLLVSLLVVAFGVMLLPAPVSAGFDEYVTYTADDYGTDGEYDYWLHTEATIKYHYVFIRGRLILTSVTWYRILHHTRTSSGPYWINFKYDVRIFIIQNNEYIFFEEIDFTAYVVRYPGMSAQTGDKFYDRSVAPGFPFLQTIITITV